MSSKLRRFIAWWQIICGGLGYLAFIVPAMNWPEGSRRLLMEYTGPFNILLGVAYFSLCIYFGRRLLHGFHDGFLMSAICQALQSVGFAFLNGPAVMIQAGPKVALTISESGFDFSVGFSSAFFLGTRVQGSAWEVTIDFLALLWAVLLVRAMPARELSTADSTA